LDFEAIRKREKPMKQVRHEIKGILGKARNQIVKDYIAWPLVSALAATAVDAVVETRRQRKQPRGILGRVKRKRQSRWAPVVEAALESGARTFRQTAKADATANIVRNVWAYAIIFCGHFPDQTYTFSQEETDDETRGGFYVRQLLGAANIDGKPLFHVISGNLGYQVEHHLFPDMPSTRYAEIAPQVKDLCERYGLPYNSGPFMQQLGMVQRTILRLAFPGGRPRPKPGPYQGENGAG
ncbi:MAG TPA: fatty acid desaturase, partial [Solirubrobacterales bacterium]|nr:fatty acid desaturase [Solirubrobacterales bacterium]